MKKNVWIRLLGLMLALLTLASVLASCGGGGDGTPTDSESGEEVTTAPQETGPATDENGYLLDSVPDDLDYDNKDFTIMGWKDRATDFDGAEDAKDTVEYATFSRNMRVENRLNINLKFDVSTAGGNSAMSDYASHVANAGGTFDLLGCYSLMISTFIMNDTTCDLSPYTQIDLSKPWWYESASSNARINNKIYFVAGALSNSISQESMVIAANLSLIDSYDLEDPRQLVLDDEWTLDTFFTMIRDRGIDNNDNGKDKEDFFGFINGYTTYLDGFYSGSGLTMLTTDSNGRVAVSSDYSGTKALDLATYMEAKLKTNDCYAPASGDISSIFSNKRAIFMATNLDWLMNHKSQMDFAYAYLPYPKQQTADVKQENFYTTVGFPATLFSIPEACSDKNRAAYVLECLASEGYRTVRSQYYQKVRYELGNSALDLQMFDIIVSNTTFDLARLLNSSFNWTISQVATFRESLTGYSQVNFVTRREKFADRLQTAINEINDKFFGTTTTD